MGSIDAKDLTFQQVNAAITKEYKTGDTKFEIVNPHAMHNLCIGMEGVAEVVIKGSAGLYLGSYLDGPRVIVEESCGWYAGDDMMQGEIIVKKNTGCNVGAYINGGTIVIYGSSGSRLGYGMKGGTVIVQKNAGRWSGYMATGGDLIVMGKIGEGTGESMYHGRIFTCDEDAESKMGGNVFLDSATDKEIQYLKELIDRYELEGDAETFKVIRPLKEGRHHYDVVHFEPDESQKHYQNI